MKMHYAIDDAVNDDIRALDSIQGEVIRVYLASDVEAHIAEVVRALRTAYLADAQRIAELKRQNSEWLAANGQGGWIDDLRWKAAELEKANSLLKWEHESIEKMQRDHQAKQDARIAELEKALRDIIEISHYDPIDSIEAKEKIATKALGLYKE